MERIVYSSANSSSDPTSTLGMILGNAQVAQIQFFINGIKTRTEGLDFVANYRNMRLGAGQLAINLAGNYTFTNEIIGSPTNHKAISDACCRIFSTQLRSLLT